MREARAPNAPSLPLASSKHLHEETIRASASDRPAFGGKTLTCTCAIIYREMSGAPPRGLRSSGSASAKVGPILAALSRRHKFTKTHQRLYMDKALHSTQLPHKTAAQARRERAGNSPVSACECVAWARERQKKHKNTVLCHELHSIYCTDRRSPTGSFPKTTSFRQTPRTRNKNTIINKLSSNHNTSWVRKRFSCTRPTSSAKTRARRLSCCRAAACAREREKNTQTRDTLTSVHTPHQPIKDHDVVHRPTRRLSAAAVRVVALFSAQAGVRRQKQRH